MGKPGKRKNREEAEVAAAPQAKAQKQLAPPAETEVQVMETMAERKARLRRERQEEAQMNNHVQNQTEEEEHEEDEAAVQSALTAISSTKSAAGFANPEKVKEQLVDRVLSQLLVDEETHRMYASNFELAIDICEPLSDDSSPIFNVISALQDKAAQLMLDAEETKGAVQRVRNHVLKIEMQSLMDKLENGEELDAIVDVLITYVDNKSDIAFTDPARARSIGDKVAELIMRTGKAAESKAGLKGQNGTVGGQVDRNEDMAEDGQDEENVEKEKKCASNEGATGKEESVNKKTTRALSWQQALRDKDDLDLMAGELRIKYFKKLAGTGEDFCVGYIMLGITLKNKAAGTRSGVKATYLEAKEQWDEKDEYEQGLWDQRVEKLREGNTSYLGDYSHDVKLKDLGSNKAVHTVPATQPTQLPTKPMSTSDAQPSIEAPMKAAANMSENVTGDGKKVKAESTDEQDYVPLPTFQMTLAERPSPHPPVSNPYPDFYPPQYPPRGPRGDRRGGDGYPRGRYFSTGSGKSYWGGYGYSG